MKVLDTALNVTFVCMAGALVALGLSTRDLISHNPVHAPGIVIVGFMVFVVPLVRILLIERE